MDGSCDIARREAAGPRREIGGALASAPPGRCGWGREGQVEDGQARPPATRHTALRWACVGERPAGGRVSFEPGGQLELSTPPAASLAELLDALRRDGDELHRRADK